MVYRYSSVDLATVNLVSFDSYKLQLNEIHFASNELYDVDLHRSDYLEKITLWAPNLHEPSVQGIRPLPCAPQKRTSHLPLCACVPANPLATGD